MESEIAGAIANQIQTKLTPEQEARLTNGRPINLKAFEAYLQGKYHSTRAQDVEIDNGQQETMKSELGVARGFFEKAISEDPNYAPAFVGLAETWRDRPVTEGGPEKAKGPWRRHSNSSRNVLGGERLAALPLSAERLLPCRYNNFGGVQRRSGQQRIHRLTPKIRVEKRSDVIPNGCHRPLWTHWTCLHR